MKSSQADFSDNQEVLSLFSHPLTLIVGHYGVGKTNVTLNLALDLSRRGKTVTVIDLDVVNPYFRSSDYEELLAQAGVRLIAPVFAGTNLDVPSLSGAILPALEQASEEHRVIIDVGGDEVGATALGRFTEAIQKQDYAMWYVINAYRSMTQTPQDAAHVLYEIEEKTALKAKGIINNSHLKNETTEETLEQASEFAEKTAALLKLPLQVTLVPWRLAGSYEKDQRVIENASPKSSMVLSTSSWQNVYYIQVYVRTPWE